MIYVCGGLLLLWAFGLLCVASLCKVKAMSDIEAEGMLAERLEKINHG